MDAQAKNHQHIIPLRKSAITLDKPAALQLTERHFVRYCARIQLSERHAKALSHLRHHQGFNPNILLFIVWQSERQHGRFKQADIKQFLHHISEWRQSVIRPLEYILEDLQAKKTATTKLLAQHIIAELQQADLVEKCLLEDLVLSQSYLPRSLEQQLQDMCHGVAMYSRLLSACLTDDDIELFVKLFQAVLTNLCPKKVADLTRQRLQKVSTQMSHGFAQLPLTLAV